MNRLILSTAVVIAVGAGAVLANSATPAYRTVGMEEAAAVSGGGTPLPVFHQCNNYICFDTSCHWNQQENYYYAGDASTAGKKACGWDWWGGCSNTGTVQCVTKKYTDANCSVYDSTSYGLAQDACN